MVIVGGVVQQIGIALAVGGFALYVGTFVFRLARLFGLHMFQRQAFLIGFYARAAGTLGIMGSFTGAIMTGAIPWPWLIAVFVFGAPSLALLLVRPVRDYPVTFPSVGRRKS